eukprot:gene4293-3109_t
MASFRKIVAHKLSVNFREATTIVAAPFPSSLPKNDILVKNKYVGINASDINFTAGIYQPDVKAPFDCGFEALGEVVSTGSHVKDLKPGDCVVTQSFGSFAEYQVVPRRHAFKTPSFDKRWLPLALSGVTASIALEEVVKPQIGDRAVVTAAAGGTGQFAAQLLRTTYKCSVVGVCSNSSKKEFIEKKIGCKAIDCSVENTRDAITSFFPRGINVAYESVGGSILDDVVDSLALRGKILSIGSISCYQNDSKELNRLQKPLSLRLLSKSATLHTFFLPHYTKHIPRHLERLYQLVQQQEIESFIDPTSFSSLDGIYHAVDFMYARKNCGKVIVQLH